MRLVERDFLYLRHGETDWNKSRTAMGQEDIELNSTGIEQANTAAEILVKYKPDINLICASPLKRAKKTAEIVASKLNVPIIENPKLMEINLGINQGRSFLDGNWMTDWEEGMQFDKAETHEQFLRRFIEGINESINRDEKVLIVSHGLAFIQLSRHLMEQVVFLPNCSPVKCTPQERFFKMQILK